MESAACPVLPLALTEPCAPKRVLLVEDDLSLEQMFDAVFHDIDPEIEVEWVTSAEEALKRIEHATMTRQGGLPFDLLVIDIFLDGVLNGADLWKQCHRRFPGMPAVVISALPWYRFHEFIETRQDRPRYIEKPLRLNECRQTLRQMIYRAR